MKIKKMFKQINYTIVNKNFKTNNIIHLVYMFITLSGEQIIQDIYLLIFITKLSQQKTKKKIFKNTRNIFFFYY